MKSHSIALFLLIGIHVNGQDLDNISIRGEFELPVQLGNKDYKKFTESIFNVDVSVQRPIWNTVGLGIGVKGALTTINSDGEIYRGVVYGKVFHDHRLGESSLLESSFKYGRSQFIHQSETCSGQNEQTANHFDIGIALHFFANESTSFAITLGYEIDTASFGPELVCADETREVYSRSGGNYRHLNIGLGFNVLFGQQGNQSTAPLN